ncbi:MAG: ATP synthase F1 subunit epsilon [Oscillospiraceae bacterium]|nr:ATP synthase F1 subunit epsilon [Oscillospiraceae bacterium]
MSVFHLSVVTPERMFFDGDVERVTVRTVSGDVGILKGHAKYISALGIGKMRIKTESGEKTAALAEGFIKVDGDKTLVLASACEWAEEIDLSRAKKAEERAR